MHEFLNNFYHIFQDSCLYFPPPHTSHDPKQILRIMLNTLTSLLAKLIITPILKKFTLLSD